MRAVSRVGRRFLGVEPEGSGVGDVNNAIVHFPKWPYTSCEPFTLDLVIPGDPQLPGGQQN